MSISGECGWQRGMFAALEMGFDRVSSHHAATESVVIQNDLNPMFVVRVNKFERVRPP